MITACEDCDHVTSDTRKGHPSRWCCIKFPRIEGFSPVAPKAWVDADPYMRCVGINGGLCPLWTARRDGPIKDRNDD
jgi:hypothetical protein